MISVPARDGLLGVLWLNVSCSFDTNVHYVPPGAFWQKENQYDTLINSRILLILDREDQKLLTREHF